MHSVLLSLETKAMNVLGMPCAVKVWRWPNGSFVQYLGASALIGSVTRGQLWIFHLCSYQNLKSFRWSYNQLLTLASVSKPDDTHWAKDKNRYGSRRG